MSQSAAASPRRPLLWATTAALGGFLFGYHAGVLSGALGPLHRELGLTSLQQGLLVSLLPLCAAAGGLLNHRLADTLGRRRTLIVDAAVILAGTALAAAAPDYAVLLAGRALVGFAVGSISSTVPLYISEISPAGSRGRLVTLNQVLVTLGILAAYLVDLALVGSGSWRAMLAAGLVPAALLLFGMLRAPESPVSVRAGGGEGAAGGRARRLLWTRARGPLLVAVALAAVQQFSGINAVVYYAPSIMEHAGLGVSHALLGSVVIGAINAAATVGALRLVDRVGRRPLLLGSLGGCFVSLALLGITFVLPQGASAGWLSLLCLLAFIVSFAVGLGPVFWLLTAELFPAEVRAAGAGTATAANWLSNFLVGLLFLPVVDAIGQGGTFFVFAGVCAAGIAFVARAVPETARDAAVEPADPGRRGPARSRAPRRVLGPQPVSGTRRRAG